MDNPTEVSREEISRLTTMVVSTLQTDPEVAICQKMSFFTNTQTDDNKVYLQLQSGETFRFAVSPIRTRKHGDGVSE